MTDQTSSVVQRPTPLAERTLMGVAIGINLQMVLFGCFMLLPFWPASTANARVHYLGWALLASALGNLIIVIGFMSPWLGTVKVSGLGAAIDINGDNPHA